MGTVFSCSIDELIQKNQVRLSAGQKRYLKVKRLLDWLFALAAILLLLPVLIAIAIAIKIDSPGERVIFRQERIGQDGKTFLLYKFRSMKTCTPELSTYAFLQTENSEQYITKIGRFLRRTSLDELPQIWNVFTGSMSIIGPRPLIKDEAEVHFLRYYYGIYQIKPGITGLAQIHGRDGLNNYEKVHWDRCYVQKISILLDLKIFLRTIRKVLIRDGILEKDHQKQDMAEAVMVDQHKCDEAARCIERSRKMI